MKIRNIKTHRMRMALATPYAIAYETISHADTIFICLETDSGLRAFGSASPDPGVTGENADQTETVANDLFPEMLIGRDLLQRAAIIHDLYPCLKDRPAALSLLDMALYDGLGKAAGLPLYQLLGGFRHRMLTSMTLGILPIDETLSQAHHWVGEGFKALKIKGGLNVDADIEAIRRLREELGPHIALRFDANQGYTIEQALQFVKGTAEANLELLEQPTPREDYHVLGQITRRSEIPVMADESLLTIRDVFRLAKNELADMVNIKLMKVGGIGRALRINAVASAANINSMVGCMDESALSISAGLHFALSSANITHVDLDGHLLIVEDPAAGAVRLEEGYLRPTGRPGLGYDVDFD
jgi:L-alanine-DL-glutamate epimerase-like enolase superfamily enzyme